MPDDAPKPRLCHMKKWPDFNGYGFNLHAERGKAGQFIGKVDLESPADVGGMKEGDRIVEVNGTNIGNENHQQVVQRIKAVPNETKLLVVDNDSDKYYKDRKIVVRGDMPNVRVFVCPDTKPTAQPNGTASQLTTVEVNHTPTQEPHVTTQVNHEEEAAPPPPLPTSAPPPEVKEEVRSEPEPVLESTPPPVAEPPRVETPPPAEPEPEPEAAPSRPLVRGKDDEPFRMSAKEFRERMVSKKRDVKNNNLSMAEKFQLFQKM